ncbi:MAG: hypothetical protein WB566_03700 [Terriglobales bacterium]
MKQSRFFILFCFLAITLRMLGGQTSPANSSPPASAAGASGAAESKAAESSPTTIAEYAPLQSNTRAPRLTPTPSIGTSSSGRFTASWYCW